MASLYRPTVIRFYDAGGRQVPKGTPGSRRVREKSNTWWGKYKGTDGQPVREALCDDHDGAETMLADKVKAARQKRLYGVDPFENHRARLLLCPLCDSLGEYLRGDERNPCDCNGEHLTAFRRYLTDKGNCLEHCRLTVSRVATVIKGCGFTLNADLSASRVVAFLADRRKAPPVEPDEGKEKRKRGRTPTAIGIATSNGYLVAMKAFCNWLMRDRRTADNPLAHLSRLNAKTDVRRERRTITPDELHRLIEAACAGKPFRGIPGTDRTMLYLTACYTGLRASELASLTPDSFDLKADPATVTVEAGYSKHRRRDVLPLQADLVVRLRQWLQTRHINLDDAPVVRLHSDAPQGRIERLWPGKWHKRAATMLRIDLEAARKDWIETKGIDDAERERREKSDTLKYVDAAGRVFDFHSTRHQFISNLAAGGVHPKLAQELARHSTITLTLDKYSHVGLMDMNAALGSLPAIRAAEAATSATGTDDVSVVPKVVPAPARLSRSQALSTLPDLPEMSAVGDGAKPRSLRENAGDCEPLTTVENEKDEWGRWDSNPEPTDYESAALTD